MEVQEGDANQRQIETGKRIKKLRKAKKWSQRDLAEACGWPWASRVSNYENGSRTINIADLEKIAQALGVQPSSIVEVEDKVPQDNRPTTSTAPAQTWIQILTEQTHNNGQGQPMIDSIGAVKEGTVPVVGTAKMTSDERFDAPDFAAPHSIGYLRIYSDDPNAYGLRLTGDRLLPRVKNGEFLLIEPSRQPEPGDEVLVITTAGDCMIKEYMYHRDGMYRLDSVNGGQPPIHIADTDVVGIQLIVGILKSTRFVHNILE